MVLAGFSKKEDSIPIRLLMLGGENIGTSTLVERLIESSSSLPADDQSFATSERSFIVSDTYLPEQKAARFGSRSLAIELVDAGIGISTQTQGQAFMAHLTGIPSIILAVNKMDSVDYNKTVFDDIVSAFQSATDGLGFNSVTAIPISALTGDNITTPSDAMPWYDGPTVIECLNAAPIPLAETTCGFRLLVQEASHLDQSTTEYAGTVVGGPIKAGDPAIVAPAGVRTSIKSILAPEGAEQTDVGISVVVELAENIVAMPGDVICHADQEVLITDQVQAHVSWISDEPMIPGRQYLLKLANQSATAWVSELKHTINVSTMEHVAAKTLEQHDIGVCNLSLDRRIACDAYADCRDTGAFVLIDRFTDATVGMGMIDFSLRRARNLTLQSLTMNKQARALAMGQKPIVIWFTGLSGAGKSTVANAVESRLFNKGHRTYLLDGDNVRHGLNRDLGFTEADRVENIRRFGEVAKLFADAGLIVLVSVISPFRGERDMVRELLDDGEFVEVFINASLATCEERDPKGLYARARKGEIENFTGIDSPYEEPLNPELVLDTDMLSPDDAADQVIRLIEAKVLER